MDERKPWQPFLSVGTVLTALAAVGVWSLQYDWLTGLLLVLILFVHEGGHTLTALWRKVPVYSPPIFLPGLGAFVMVGAGGRRLDQALIILGGPVVSGLFSLIVKLIGIAAGLPAVAAAGSLGILLNLVNLLPLGPLDGGRMAAISRGPGILIAVLAGGFLTFWAYGTGNMVLVAVILVFAYMTLGKVDYRRELREGWGEGIGLTVMHLLAAALLVAGWRYSGPVSIVKSNAHPWLGPIQTASMAYFGLLLLSTAVFRYAWMPTASARFRYVLTAALGWPQHLLTGLWFIPIVWALAGYTLGLPTLGWVERLTRRLASRKAAPAGHATAWVYDALARQGSGSEAEEWLERMTPVVSDAGAWAVYHCSTQLAAAGYRKLSYRWFITAVEGGLKPDQLPPVAGNNLAWALYIAGRPQQALPFIQTALAASPDTPSFLDTLGRIQLALGDAANAETSLRKALAGGAPCGTRVALAQAVAARSRYAEAVGEAQRALAEQKGPWHEDEPDGATISRWIEEWQTAVQPA